MSAEHESRPGTTFATFLCCVLGMVTCVYILPGVSSPSGLATVAAGVVLGVAYLVIRPFLRIITLPLGCLTLGLTNIVIDIGLIYLCTHLIQGFFVESFLYAALCSILINSLCAVVGGFR